MPFIRRAPGHKGQKCTPSSQMCAAFQPQRGLRDSAAKRAPKATDPLPTERWGLYHLLKAGRWLLQQRMEEGRSLCSEASQRAAGVRLPGPSPWETPSLNLATAWRSPIHMDRPQAGATLESGLRHHWDGPASGSSTGTSQPGPDNLEQRQSHPTAAGSNS